MQPKQGLTKATFVATDPYHRADDESKLRNLLTYLRGVKDWQADKDGEITVEYDHEVTSSNVIEEALAGIGYRVKHVHDDARLGKADRPNYGVSEENKGGQSYGNKTDR
jgi:hypothetical protein